MRAVVVICTPVTPVRRRAGIHVHDAVLLTSADETRVRVQLQLYDTTEHAELQRPRPFYWSPSLGFLIRVPNADTLAGELLTRLWAELRSRGYWPSAALRAGTHTESTGIEGFFGWLFALACVSQVAKFLRGIGIS
mgnify:CR=1 FL=1